MVQNSEPGKKNFLKPKENIPKQGELFFDFEGEVAEPQTTETGLPFKSKSISVVSSSYLVDDQTYFFGKR
ncbi:concanavalin A-like lectin/glucanase, partial [Leptospira sp. 201903075]|nr:concanavalin A-like lectin/glucanase [Leptospira chreensis]